MTDRPGPSPVDLPHGPDVAEPTGEQVPRKAYVAQIMGLPVSVHVRGPEVAGAAVGAAVERAFDRLRADEAEFSTWREDSAVSRIRRGELKLADASERVRKVAALCEEAAERTDGAFSAWLPDGHGGRAFDPTGMVKGWAVQETFGGLRSDLAALGSYDALVAAGGDIALACERTDTPDWVVGVEDPGDRAHMLTSLSLRSGAVATSGSAARGHHVVDPRTGRAATALLSATVVGPELLWVDVYATALFAAEGDAPWFDAALEDHTALLRTRDGRTVIRSQDTRPSGDSR